MARTASKNNKTVIGQREIDRAAARQKGSQPDQAGGAGRPAVRPPRNNDTRARPHARQGPTLELRLNHKISEQGSNKHGRGMRQGFRVGFEAEPQKDQQTKGSEQQAKLTCFPQASRALGLTWCEKPKSDRVTPPRFPAPSSTRRMFSGLMSRCKMPETERSREVEASKEQQNQQQRQQQQERRAKRCNTGAAVADTRCCGMARHGTAAAAAAAV